MAEAGGEAGTRIKAKRRKRATRSEMALREARILESLTAGLSTADVAAREGLSLRRTRELAAEIFARRPIDQPAIFLQAQIRRLSEAMLVSYSAMSGGNLKAVDRVVKVARELERLHGLAPAVLAPAPLAPPQVPLAPPPAPLALAPPQNTGAAVNEVREQKSWRGSAWVRRIDSWGLVRIPELAVF